MIYKNFVNKLKIYKDFSYKGFLYIYIFSVNMEGGIVIVRFFIIIFIFLVYK